MTRRWLVLPFVWLISAHADTLIFRNGAKLTGSWVSVDAERVEFMVDGQVHAYLRADVSAVTFGGEPANGPVKVPAVRAPAEPENIGVVYLQDESGALQPLERNQGVERTGGLSRGQGGMYWEMAGAKSPVRLRSGQKMLFVVRLANGIDPATFSLFPLDTRQNKRRTRSDPRSRSAPLQWALTITNVGEVSYGLTPVNQLPAGEYAFSAANSNDAYCFAVDPAPGQ
jgi:hypothetical protein